LKEILIKLYELNERYHDTKEKMIWLGSSLYFIFSFTILIFIVSNKNFKWPTHNSIYLIIFLTLIFINALLFIWFQIKKKRASLQYTKQLERELSELKLQDENKLKEIFKCRDKIFYGMVTHPEIFIIAPVFIFYIAQLILIIKPF